MLGKFSRIPIITLLAVVLLMAACTTSQAKLKWSLSGGYNPSTGTWTVTIDVHRVDSAEALIVQGFGFDLTYPAGTYTGLELLGPYTPPPPPLSPDGGVSWVEASAPGGAVLPDGQDGNVDLARFHVDSFFDVFTELTVSDGYVEMQDGTRDYNVDPVSFVVPEPSSVAALLTGVVGLAGFGIRRRKTS